MDAEASSASPRSEADTSRRRLLTVMGAGGAAVLATLVSSKEARAGHDSTNVMHLGEGNSAPGPTGVSANVEGPMLLLQNDHPDGASMHVGAPMAVFVETDTDALLVENQGSSETSGGISATAHGGPQGVEGLAFPSTDPLGGVGVRGASMSESNGYGEGPGIGVHGSSGTGVAVSGFSPGTGTAVDGESQSGVGVRGITNNPESIGVWALNSQGGFGLAVGGKSAFDTVGTGVVPAGQSSGFVAEGQVTADSHISVTLASDPGDRTIRWIERNPGSGFTVHLTTAPPSKRPATSLTYLVVEPGF